MTPPEILDAVAAVESAGASLALVDGRPRLFGNVEAVPADARALLRGRSAELAAYLSSAARPSPEWALFVSKRLGLVELPAAVVGPVFWRDGQAYFQATPAVASAVSRLVESFKRNRRADPVKVAEADRVVAGLWAWVERYYPPHAIRAARSRPHVLPEVKPPDECPGAEAWAVRTGGGVYEGVQGSAAGRAGGP